MPGGRWVVDALDAYTIWEVRHRPSAEDKGLVVNWLAEREALGPPADATVDDRQNYTVRAGPIEFYFRDSTGPARIQPATSSSWRSGDGSDSHNRRSEDQWSLFHLGVRVEKLDDGSPFSDLLRRILE